MKPEEAAREAWIVTAGLAAILLFFSACAALTPPQTTDQRLAYAYGTHTAVMDAAAVAVERGELSPETGTAVLEMADQARTLLDSARFVLSTGDTKTAEGQLMLAIGILTELQNYLRRAQ